MMARILVTQVLLIALIAAAVFGLYLPFMGHGEHGMSCPFVFGGMAICAAPLAHLEHWQAAFLAVFVEALVLCVLAVVFFSRYDLFDPDVGRYEIYRVPDRVSIRPSLFQELFSDGILHRKEPHHS